MKTGELNYIEIVKQYEDRVGITSADYDYQVYQGSGRYNKVVAEAKVGASLRAVAFIDRTTGSVFRAGSWSKPARTRIA